MYREDEDDPPASDERSENEIENEEADANLSEEDDEIDFVPAPAQTYARLLQVLQPTTTNDHRPSKRRKLDTNPHGIDVTALQNVEDNADDLGGAGLAETLEDDPDEVSNSDSDTDDTQSHDPFQRHFCDVEEDKLERMVEARAEPSDVQKSTIKPGVRKLRTVYNSTRTSLEAGPSKVDLKKRLAEEGNKTIKLLSEGERDLLDEMLHYRDILCGLRTVDNAGRLRDVTSLHVLNHLFKTRDRVLKNNAKLNTDADADADYRDQGFTRAKVLIIVPTKQACAKYIDSIVKLSRPDQQENKSRFLETFTHPEDEAFVNKPEDFQELFSGNHEEDFRVGLKFTRKTIKFFSGFYNSDIIFASALGMMRTITAGGGDQNSKKVHDADFLSSIEVAVVDQANAIEMQNWQHLDYVFSQLNLIPKESHGCDFARARSWYLDGKAQYLRQTIILSEYLTPQITALASTHLRNTAGTVKYTPIYPGTMLKLPPQLPLTITQSFIRFNAPTPQADSDARFKFFTTTILPSLLRGKHNSSGTLIFVPTYLDFVRLRNHFSTSAETTSLTFGTISEYSTVKEVARARSHFLSGRHSVTLYSERAHHYFRYKIKGVKRVLFYGVPDNPTFWVEMLDMLAANATADVEWTQSQRGKQGKGMVRALFSRWDVMKLERVVGTERVGRLVREEEGDVFDFV